MTKKDNKKTKNQNAPTIVNRRARHEYHFVQIYEAGLVLTGTEVKAIREGKVNLTDAFCYFLGNQLFVKNMHISEYKHGTYNNHNPLTVRKILLHKAELRKLSSKIKDKGMTIIPHKLYFNERGFAKLEICLAQGKQEFDKRDSIKERDSKTELDRAKKAFKNKYEL